MAERKSGPVKPPVIDLKAREASEPAASDVSAGADEVPERKTGSPRRGARARTEGTPAPTATAATEPGETAAPTATPAEPMPGRSAPESAAAATADEEIARAERASSTDTEAAATTATPPPPPRPPARLAMPWSAISVAAAGGAVLGAGLTYLLATWIALPQQEPPFADPSAALTELATAVGALDTRLSAVEDTARTTRVSLNATLTQFDSAMAELRTQIAGVEAAIPEPQAVDLSAIESELQTLESRVAAIAAGASSDDAAALANDLAGIETALGTVTGRLDAFEDRLSQDDSRLATLASELEAAQAAIAAQTRTLGGADIGPAVKLPLIVSGLEAAFGNGRSYAAELDSLTTLLPDLSVPPIVAAEAEAGLARPDALAARFNAALPDIIAGRTRESSGDLAQDALEWAKSLLALRPAEETEGDTPEAIVSRLEAAMQRRDFVAAATALAQLPAPMQEAAGDVGADIAAHAQAAAFINRLRAQALAPATEPAS